MRAARPLATSENPALALQGVDFRTGLGYTACVAPCQPTQMGMIIGHPFVDFILVAVVRNDSGHAKAEEQEKKTDEDQDFDLRDDGFAGQLQGFHPRQ